MTMPDPDLHVPPSEIELAQLLTAVSAALGPSAALVLRRLACERDWLRDDWDAVRRSWEHAFPDRPWGACPREQRAVGLLISLQVEVNWLRAALAGEPAQRKPGPENA